ncbi:MAG: UPF0178 protein Daro_2879 [uncultured Sulfurovum sp.]|uniref:UPF0178 protein HELGO_WM13286 n=1 Tax=uncultured Sulfurovum sp. TaxID=269237 RepID=A0A6S6SYA2_9BACT|nr:MAG: UPF0178 protein Daro_2879 [uncultured Sulfurovum sp.]
MTLFIDGDAFPNLLKPIVLKAIERLKLKTYVIANKKINMGKSKYLEYLVVEQGADEADDKIVERLVANDLVITADIPLADRIIAKDAHAIDHRGELYSIENIKQYLTMRNFMQEMRDAGEITGGPKAFGQKDAQNFANQLNSFLQKIEKQY